jgi:hypothetical protein
MFIEDDGNARKFSRLNSSFPSSSITENYVVGGGELVIFFHSYILNFQYMVISAKTM